MPKWSKESSDKLHTCDTRLIKLFDKVIESIDCKIIYGHRSSSLQFELYKQGRENINGKWIVVDKKRIVTNCDGINTKSMHNYYPSLAIDVIPYPVDWEDMNRFYHYIGFVRGIATMMKINITSGIDWNSNFDLKDQNFFDYPHFQVAEK